MAKKQVSVICSGAKECCAWRHNNCCHKGNHIWSTDCRSHKVFESQPEPVWRYCVRAHRSVRCVKVKGV